MRPVLIALGALAAVALAGCGEKSGEVGASAERTAEASTGTAEVEITTTAPPSQVPDAQLQSQAQQAATAASTPVDGSGPIAVTAPAVPPTGPATPAPAPVP